MGRVSENDKDGLFRNNIPDKMKKMKKHPILKGSVNNSKKRHDMIAKTFDKNKDESPNVSSKYSKPIHREGSHGNKNSSLQLEPSEKTEVNLKDLFQQSIEKTALQRNKSQDRVFEYLFGYIFPILCRNLKWPYLQSITPELQVRAKQSKLKDVGNSATTDLSEGFPTKLQELSLLIAEEKGNVAFYADTLFDFQPIQTKHAKPFYSIVDMDSICTFGKLPFSCGNIRHQFDCFYHEKSLSSCMFPQKAIYSLQPDINVFTFLIDELTSQLEKKGLEELFPLEDHTDVELGLAKPQKDAVDCKTPDTEVRIVPSEYFDEWAYHRVKEVVMTLLGGLADTRAESLRCVTRFKLLCNSTVKDVQDRIEQIIEYLLAEAGIIAVTSYFRRIKRKVKKFVNSFENLITQLFDESSNPPCDQQ